MSLKPTRKYLFLPVILLCAVTLTFARGGGVHAQGEGGVTLTARAGFDGYCKEGEWIPVRVTVENSGADVEARVQASYSSFGTSRSSFGAELSLPGNSRKETFLYIYPRDSVQTLKVSVIANGKEITKTDLKLTCISSPNLLFGLLTDDSTIFTALNATDPLSSFVRVASLTIPDLPDRAQGWRGLDALVVSGADTGALNPDQKQALGLWLAEGGKLFVTGGTKWQASTAGLGEFLPVDLNATKKAASLSALAEYVGEENALEGEAVLASGKMRAGAEILLSQDGVPLIVQKRIGFGGVIYFAADPALRPLSGWDGMKDVYSKLLGSEAQRPSWARGAWDYYFANQALGALSELGIPSPFFICGMMGFYVIVVGPLNFLALRYFKRRELAWVTVPVLVIMFTGLAYFSGYIFRGARPILNRLVIVQAWDGVEQAQARALVGIYSPGRSKYTVEADSKFLPHPFASADLTLQAEDDWLSLGKSAKMTVPDVRVEIGGMQAMAWDGVVDALRIEHDLTVNLGDSSPTLTGSIFNAGEYILKDAMLVTSGDWIRLGDLPPGTSKDVKVSLVSGYYGPEFYTLAGADILNVNYYAPLTEEEDMRKVSLMSSVAQWNYGGNMGNWGIYLMGWLDDPLVPVSLQNRDANMVDTNLYIAMLSPSVKKEPGLLNLPSSLFIWESTNEAYSPYRASGVPGSSYELRFTPAIPLRFSEVRNFELDVNSSSYSYSPSYVIRVSVWDYESGAWFELQNYSGGAMNLADPSRYVDSNGEVWLRIEGDPNGWLELDSVKFTLTVAP